MSKVQRDFERIIKEEDSLKQKIVDISNQLSNCDNNLNEVRIKKRDKGLQYYSIERRKEIIKRAQNIGFSAEDINKMLLFEDNTHWNQDEVVIDIIDLFCKAEQFIKNNEYKQPLIVKFIEHLGDLSDKEKSEDERQ